MNRKKRIISISIVILLAILVCAGIFLIYEVRKSKIENNLNLGEEYLENLKYKEALTTYEAVLKIDLKSVDAYLGIADAYIAMGENEKALEILEEGYEETEDNAIKRKINKVENLKNNEADELETPKESQVMEEPEEMIETSKIAVEVAVTYNYEDVYSESFSMIMEHEEATIVGLADDGTEIWRYEAEKCPRLDFSQMGEIGIHGNVFYFNDKGTLIAFEITTGKILWETEWKSSSIAHYVFDEEGNMYLTGSSGPDLLIVSPQGEELKRVKSLDEDYYWAYDIELIDDYVFISYEGYSDLAYDGGKRILSYCLADGAVELVHNSVTSEEIKKEELVLSDEDVIDWKDANLEVAMREVTGIYDRDILYGDVKDIVGLELMDNDISDISALSNLTSLGWLYLDGNSITDISALGNLTNLQELSLHNNNISDVSGLGNLKKLKILSLSGAAISDISALSNLTNLEELYLFNNSISDISALRNLTNLRGLSLSNNTISDISALSNLMNLGYLDLRYNAISDISALSNLTSLGNLDLGYNDISDVSALNNLTSLEYLNLVYNDISDISGLSNLVNLDRLDLYNNAISDVSALSNLMNLRSLYINDNAISDISALKDLANLELLDLSGNPITDYSPVSHVIGLYY